MSTQLGGNNRSSTNRGGLAPILEQVPRIEVLVLRSSQMIQFTR
jgi:hypothetical protein